MDYNYHTHTFRCHHASGEEKEYIKKAIEGGIKDLGFADHAPFQFPGEYQSWYRVSVRRTPEYFQVLRELRKKYYKKINIFIGFEMEYYPAYFDAMLKNVVDAGCEYLILGQHYIYNEYPDGVYIFDPFDSELYLRDYVDTVIEAMETGVFSYVAHPDLPSFTGDVDFYKEEMRRICKASKRLDLPLEINFLGLRQRRNYPNEAFWEVAGQEQCPVTFGTDSHSPDSIFQPDIVRQAEKLVDTYSLHYIGKPKLIML